MYSYWDAIEKALDEVESAKNVEEVITILNRYNTPSAGAAFFAGSGGDRSLLGSLQIAGWRTAWMEADYFYAVVSPNGCALTYIEGDVQRGG